MVWPGNKASAGGSVPLVRGDEELARLADRRAEDALVPSLDDAVDAGLVREGLLSRALGGPELLRRSY